MKIYDCFTFCNELDLLEFRLQEHWNYVDRFVIVEANKTFSGNRTKLFNLEDNWDRFKDYHDKITYIKLDDMPGGPDPWARELYQRNALARGYVDADPRDVVAISDLDEIVRRSSWEHMRNNPDNEIWAIKNTIFHFKFNYLFTSKEYEYCYMTTTMAARAGCNKTPMQIRDVRVEVDKTPSYLRIKRNMKLINHGGWHFSFLGDTEFAATKLQNASDEQYSHLANIVDVDKAIKKSSGLNPDNPRLIFKPVKLDNYFPPTLLENQSKWSKYIIQDENLPSVGEFFNNAFNNIK
jgi:hypothetical protein